jgi:CBS domain-containing protein
MGVATGMQTKYFVKDVMTKQPITVSSEATLQQCAGVMAEHHVGSVIVEDEKLVGIITEQDIVRKAVIHNRKPSQTLAGEIMERKLITISPDASIADALQLMAEKNIRHLPVLDTTDMVGLITGKDILKLNPTLFETIAHKIERREEQDKAGGE